MVKIIDQNWGYHTYNRVCRASLYGYTYKNNFSYLFDDITILLSFCFESGLLACPAACQHFVHVIYTCVFEIAKLAHVMEILNLQPPTRLVSYHSVQMNVLIATNRISFC